MGQFAREPVQCAAVWASGFAAVIERNHYFRVRIPQVHVGHWASQWQILCRNFDNALIDVMPVPGQKFFVFAHSALLKCSLTSQCAEGACPLHNQKKLVAIWW